MRIRARLIESIVDAATTADGGHVALRLRDVDAEEFTLGVPIEQIGQLIELGAQALRDCAQQGEDIEARLLGTSGRFPVTWWNLARRPDDGIVVLTLTLASGGTLAFELPSAMADTLGRAVTTAAPLVDGGPRGFE
jgi:hypothetical protein